MFCQRKYAFLVLLRELPKEMLPVRALGSKCWLVGFRGHGLLSFGDVSRSCDIQLLGGQGNIGGEPGPLHLVYNRGGC